MATIQKLGLFHEGFMRGFGKSNGTIIQIILEVSTKRILFPRKKGHTAPLGVNLIFFGQFLIMAGYWLEYHLEANIQIVTNIVNDVRYVFPSSRGLHLEQPGYVIRTFAQGRHCILPFPYRTFILPEDFVQYIM